MRGNRIAPVLKPPRNRKSSAEPIYSVVFFQPPNFFFSLCFLLLWKVETSPACCVKGFAGLDVRNFLLLLAKCEVFSRYVVVVEVLRRPVVVSDASQPSDSFVFVALRTRATNSGTDGNLDHSIRSFFLLFLDSIHEEVVFWKNS